MKIKAKLTHLTVLIGVLFLGGTAQSALISSIEPATGGGLGSSTASFDNTAETVSLEKVFDEVKPIEFVFNLNDAGDPGGGTEFLFSETVTNNTGEEWKDFHFALLVWKDNDGWVQSPNLDGLQFMDNHTGTDDPTSSEFEDYKINHLPDTMDWDNGKVPLGQQVGFTFWLNIHDNLTDSKFMLREVPSVPEPPIFAVMGLGLASLGFYRRTKRRQH